MKKTGKTFGTMISLDKYRVSNMALVYHMKCPVDCLKLFQMMSAGRIEKGKTLLMIPVKPMAALGAEAGLRFETET